MITKYTKHKQEAKILMRHNRMYIEVRIIVEFIA